MHTKDGPSGVGYSMEMGARPSGTVAGIVGELSQVVIGQDALGPEALWERIWSRNKPKLQGGVACWALSALDTAWWDVLAKSAGLPLHTLLGGHRREVPVYGSGGRRGLSDSDLVAECVGFAERGASAYKFKIGDADDAEERSSDEDRIALLRKEMGSDFTLFADANQAYDVREALEIASMLRHYDIAWFEEPVPAHSIGDLAAVSRGSAVPVAAGENVYFRWGFRELCERGAAAILQPDIGRCGGVSEFRKIAHLAESFGLALCSHVVPELSATLVGASPAGYLVEYVEHAPEDLWASPFPIVAGKLTVPDVPGHGVELSVEARTRYAVS